MKRDHGKMIQHVITLIIKWLNSLYYTEATVFHHWLTINGLPACCGALKHKSWTFVLTDFISKLFNYFHCFFLSFLCDLQGFQGPNLEHNCCCSVTKSCAALADHGLQHARQTWSTGEGNMQTTVTFLPQDPMEHNKLLTIVVK